jgi:translation initiation factor IF-2
MILLVAEMDSFKANPKTKAVGTVIESNKDPQRGVEATVLVQNGTLALGDVVTVGPIFGKIKLMENYLGKRVNHAKPSTPIKILGLESVPNAGDILFAEESLEKAKQKITKLKKVAPIKTTKSDASDKDDKIKKLNIIIKADVQGSVEAILESLQKIKSEDVQANILNYGAGKITESDVMMASSASAFIAGFNAQPTTVAKRMAEDLKVEIKTYSVIYDLIDEIKSKLEEMIEPEIKTKELGTLEVLQLFRTEKGKMIVGGRVTSKHLENNSQARIIRDDKEIGQGKIISLQAGKVDVPEVQQSNECGIVFEGQIKIKEGDQIETWKEETIKKTL